MKVICIEDKPIFDAPQAEWLIKKGETYSITRIHYYNKWMYYELDIQDGVAYPIELFAPIEENFQSITLEKILEEETKFVSAN